VRWWIGILALPVPALAQSFEVVSGEARYRVREQLAQIGITDAVGTTKAVKGEVRLQGGQATGSFTADLRELRSDQARRDNYLRQNTLETDRFPTASFRPKRVEGLPNPLPQSGKFPVKVVGDLTIRDVTQEVVWEGRRSFPARRRGSSCAPSSPLRGSAWSNPGCPSSSAWKTASCWRWTWS